MSLNLFTPEELFNLYKLEIDRENEIRSKWRKSMEVYLTMLLTVFSGCLVFANFLKEVTLIMLCFIGGGTIIIMLALIAYFHFKLDYKYQMEILSIQAKIEDMLGLTSPEKCVLPPRWGNEALLPPWYYADKEENSSSEKFVLKMCSFKSINFYPIVYAIFSLLGIGLIIFGIMLRLIK